MTRPRALPGTLKTGAGRTASGAAKVFDVESLACPATLGAEHHELRNNAQAVTRCRWCARDWASPDAAARGDAA